MHLSISTLSSQYPSKVSFLSAVVVNLLLLPLFWDCVYLDKVNDFLFRMGSVCLFVCILVCCWSFFLFDR